MRIGLDASNLRRGGGVTHLRQLVDIADPDRHGFERLSVWASRPVLEMLPADRPWLDLNAHPWLDGGLAARTAWRYRHLGRALARDSDILFAPGGLLSPTRLPRVTMSRNMLPFERAEIERYPLGRERLRLELLLRGQSRSFMKADGVIFLTGYAQRQVISQLPRPPKRHAVIAHGVASRFEGPLREPEPLEAYNSADRPFRLLYVSSVHRHKHQWTVVRAVMEAVRRGAPLRLDMAGGGEASSVARLKAAIAEHDPEGAATTYHGAVPFDQMHEFYRQADGVIFASSCENLPNILLESMSAGAPILCSNHEPMPEVLGEGGLYFDPVSAESLSAVLDTFLSDLEGRYTRSLIAAERAAAFTWEKCARETFGFLRNVCENCS